MASGDRVPLPPTIDTLALIVTRSCDLSCTYCAASKREEHLDPGLAVRAVREFGERGGRRVRLTGGEPTRRWDTVEAVLAEVDRLRAQGREFTVELCTNGRSLDAGRRATLDAPWTHVTVSVDGLPDVQRAAGRTPLPALAALLSASTTRVTQTLAPGMAHRALDGLIHLWELGARRFNVLPVYYTRWRAAELRHLQEALAGMADFLRPRVAEGRARVRNLNRRGSVPLFADDLTLDVDGTFYRTNLVLADRFTRPLLPELRVDPAAPAPVPRDLHTRLEALLPKAVRRSNRRVDAALDRFVVALRASPPRPPRPEPRRRPTRLEFHLSYTCDNDCVFCSEADRLRRWRASPVTATEVRRTLLSHARAGGEHVLFTGGEPTLHPALPFALRLARELGLRTAVGTSGQRLGDAGYAARVLPHLDELSLSLHGADAATHDASTGRSGSFARLLATRGHARELAPGLSPAANAVVTRHNAEQLEGIVSLCGELNVGRLLLSNVAPEGAALGRYEDLAVPLERWRRQAAGLVALGDRAGVRLRFFGLPLCALGDARMRSNDLYYDARVTVERARGPRDSVRLSHVATRHPRRGRRWTRRCRTCRYREVCGGVFRAYLERFGDHEIRPIEG